MSEPVKVSIVTVCRNAEALILSTLDSVSAIAGRAPRKYFIEYIVIDGDSTDSTLDIICRWRDSLNAFKSWSLVVVSEKDDGIYDAFNKGLGIASGQYALFLSAGDRLEAGLLDELTSRVMAGDLIDVIVGKVADIDPAGVCLGYRFHSRKWFWLINRSLCHTASIVKTECYRAIGGFDTTYRYAADLKAMLTLEKNHGLSWESSVAPAVQMLTGGASQSVGWPSESIRAVHEAKGVVFAVVLFARLAVLRSVARLLRLAR